MKEARFDKMDYDMEELACYFWLSRAEHLGNGTKRKIIEKMGDIRSLYKENEKILRTILQEKQVEAILEARKNNWRQEFDAMLKKGILFYPENHPLYPKRLLKIEDRPLGLFVKGKLPDEEKRSIAIVGARDCSEYGRFVTEGFADKLARAGIIIISGMARGVDGIAMNAALSAGGEAYGVLGSGVDVCYPPNNRKLYDTVLQRGGIISEYVPGMQPLPYNFPARNRIISGLADLVLVVEARQKSGTLITVDMALEQGKEVFVVPGRITDRLSDGCNKLIGQGAGVALTPEQLIAELGGIDKLIKGSTEKGDFTGLSIKEQALLSCLTLEKSALLQIMEKAHNIPLLENLEAKDLTEMLVMLMLRGYVKSEGGYYQLFVPFSG